MKLRTWKARTSGWYYSMMDRRLINVALSAKSTGISSSCESFRVPLVALEPSRQRLFPSFEKRPFCLSFSLCYVNNRRVIVERSFPRNFGTTRRLRIHGETSRTASRFSFKVLRSIHTVNIAEQNEFTRRRWLAFPAKLNHRVFVSRSIGISRRLLVIHREYDHQWINWLNESEWWITRSDNAAISLSSLAFVLINREAHVEIPINLGRAHCQTKPVLSASESSEIDTRKRSLLRLKYSAIHVSRYVF